ncbi:SMC-Scp complex subunit ScpB [Streptococcus sp. sy010]|uniref:SMC-Scp complex subunit ScpB n=1 Tax=Streptococcus sp. sy010 TaxID=2600148 RepID=UPI0011B75DBD|nr:SMC-Scp complex subunit ScpB [Streptococcus sp. sy010]TWT16239.1 segregation/condensation protein B [Streptococcus sp. sy010]
MANDLAALEALLFVAGEDGLSLRQLTELLDVLPSALLQQLDQLSDKYQNDETSSLSLLLSANRYKLVTKDVHADLLGRYAQTPINQSLSRASLEVLSIIAYKQPITRVEVDAIRGVNSSGAISKLQAFNLIEEAGKKDVLGRPNLYRTTDYFLDYLGINELSELIDVSDLAVTEEPISLFNTEDLAEE